MLLPIIVGIVLTAVGVYDDLGTLLGREKREAHNRIDMVLKLSAFAAIGGLSAWLLYSVIDAPRLLVPHYGRYDIGPVYIVIAIAVIVSVTSAVGVTDGLDMLEGSTNAVAFTAFGAIALMQQDTALATFCFAVAGALVGFLWWNAYPARLFMGDAGSLPLGATLAIVALMTGWWLLLPVIGVVFVVEYPLRRHPDRLLPDDGRQAILPDGAAAPPLREARLARDHGHGPLPGDRSRRRPLRRRAG